MITDCPYLSEPFLTQVWEQFKPHLKRKKTQNSYLSFIKNLSNFCQRDFLEITSDDVDHYFAQRLSEENGPGIKSLHTMLSAYRSVASYIQEHKDEVSMPCYASPFDECELPPYTDVFHSTDVIRIKDFDKLLQTAKEDSQVYLALCLAFRCALTVSEILGLKVNQVTMYRDGSGQVVIPQAGGRMRYVKIPADVMDVIVRDFSHLSPESNLLLNTYGHPMSARTLQTRVKQCVMRSEIFHPYTLQDLRNSALIYMRKGGATDEELSTYAGTTGRWLYRFTDEVIPLEAPCDYVAVRVM